MRCTVIPNTMKFLTKKYVFQSVHKIEILYLNSFPLLIKLVKVCFKSCFFVKYFTGFISVCSYFRLRKFFIKLLNFFFGFFYFIFYFLYLIFQFSFFCLLLFLGLVAELSFWNSFFFCLCFFWANQSFFSLGSIFLFYIIIIVS